MTAGTDTPAGRLHQKYFTLYPAEATRALEDLPPQEIAAVLSAQPVKVSANIWERLSPDVGARVMGACSQTTALDVLTGIDPNRGAVLLSGLDESVRRELLSRLPPQPATELERSMSYPPGSAGTLMDTQVTYYTADMSVGEALSRLRSQRRRGFRVAFLVDRDNRLQGMVDIQDLALSEQKVRLKELSRVVPAYVEAMMPAEEVVENFERYRVTDLPVIDYDGRLLGVIRYHALVEAAKAESSADIQTMVGVSKEERALSRAGFAVRKRLPWLQINLATAFLAAAVVGIFEGTIAKYTALAVLLPVVAGQSGNTGAQALAVTMRGLALREIQVRHWPRIVFKEINVGFWNGLAVAATTALGVFVWSQSMGLCLVIAISMVISMVAAGLSGAAIPILLTTLGQDPAQSSSIFLTTVTDIVGFFSFLGIATLLSGIL
ncbi:MAG: magnesium transporter [Gammaproteobacteria bacterium]|nr:magnesium transporter [Gammaproteobacteria bacterium]